MAIVRTKLGFGLIISIKSPIMLGKDILNKYLLHAQNTLNVALMQAVRTTVNLIPGVRAEISDAKTVLEVIDIEP
jgi:hypothetical protein